MRKQSFLAISLFFLFAAILSINFYNVALAIDPNVKAPENIDEAKKVGEKTFELAKNDLPGIIKNIWQTEVWPVWKKIGETMKNFWNVYVQNSWERLKDIFKKEIDMRKPQIKEDFQKEKTELKTEAPAVGKSFLEKIKEIIQ